MPLQKKQQDFEMSSFSQICAELSQSLPADTKPNQDLRLADRGSDTKELKAHEPKFFGDKFSSKTRAEHQNAARDLLVNSLRREAGNERADEILQKAGVSVKPGPVTVEQMRTMSNELARLYAQDVQVASTNWNGAFNQGTTPTPATLNEGVASLSNDPASTWKVAGSGAGAALIVKSNSESSGGAVIKFDDADKAVASEEISRIAQHVAANSKVAPPIQFAAVTTVTELNDQDHAQLTERIKELKVKSGDDRLDGHLEKAGALKQSLGETPPRHAISKMSLVDGVPLNELPFADRVALVKSPEYARQAGRTAISTSMFGLNDHPGIRPPISGKQEGANFEMTMINPSNISINPTTGAIPVMDYSTGVVGLSKNGVNTIPGYKNLDAGIKATSDFLGPAAESQEALNAGVDRIMTDLSQTDTIDGSTTLSASVAVYLAPQGKDGMFGLSEAAALDSLLSTGEKEEFVRQFMAGAAEEMMNVQQNADVYSDAYKASSQRLADRGRLLPGEEAFVSRVQMENIKTTLNGLAENGFKEKMDRLVPHPNPPANTVSQAPKVNEELSFEQFASRFSASAVQQMTASSARVVERQRTNDGTIPTQRVRDSVNLSSDDDQQSAKISVERNRDDMDLAEDQGKPGHVDAVRKKFQPQEPPKRETNSPDSPGRKLT